MKPKTNINHKKIYLAVFLLAVVFGLGIFNVQPTNAANSCGSPNGCCTCTKTTTNNGIGIPSNTVCFGATDQTSCAAMCPGPTNQYSNCQWVPTDPNNPNAPGQPNQLQNQLQQQVTTKQTQLDNTICIGLSMTNPITWFNCILLIVLKFFAMLLGASATLFMMVIDPSIFTTVVGSSAIYTAWADVRDILNVAFIMVLLFSAFCTVFQIDKFNYKNILLKLIIMALLVNFSYPIALFIIDASNVLMYYFINALGFSSQITSLGATLANTGGLAHIVAPDPNMQSNTAFLLAAVLFVFLFVATLLIIGILLLIRIVVLAVLVVFSSVAFVGSIVPGLSSEAGKWWDKLFKQAFFGPIMVFMIYIALALMQAMTTSGIQAKFNTAGQTQGGALGSFIGPMAFFLLPLAILWTGLGFAESLGATGASMARKYGFKATKWATKAPGKAAWYGIKKTGVPGGVKQSWNKNVTQRFDRAQKKRDAKWAGRLWDKSASERDMKNRSAEYEKNNETADDLKKWAAAGDAAAAFSLASRGKIDPATFATAMNKIKDAKTKESLMGKTSDTRMDVTLQYKFDLNNAKGAAGDPTTKPWKDLADVAAHEYGNLTAEEWAKQKDLPDQLDPSKVHADVIKAAKDAFNDLKDPAKFEAFKRMNGKNAKAVS